MRETKAKETTKVGKAAKVLRIAILALVATFIILAVALSGGDKMAPEEIKTAAGEKDLEIAQSVWSAQQYTVRFEEEIQGLGSGENSLLDVYSYAGDAADFMLELASRVDSVDMSGDVATAYKDTAKRYIAMVRLVATDIRDFMDTNEHSELEEIQTSMASLLALEDQFTETRTAYLKDAGFTDEEISSRPTLDGTKTEE